MNKKKLSGYAIVFFVITLLNLPTAVKAFTEKGVWFGIAYTLISYLFYICIFALAGKAGTLIAEGEIEKLEEKYPLRKPFGISDEEMGVIAKQVLDDAKSGVAGIEISIKDGKPSVKTMTHEEVKAKLAEDKKESKQVGHTKKVVKPSKKVTKSKK